MICESLERDILAELDFKTIVEKTETYVNEIRTLFVLDSLETMRKNGRITKVKALAANMLNIKPVLHGVDGEIQQLDQARGMNKALDKMIQNVIAKTKNCENRVLAISHCNCPERAKAVKEKIEKLAKFKKIIVTDTAGVSTMYANDGGVIIAV